MHIDDERSNTNASILELQFQGDSISDYEIAGSWRIEENNSEDRNFLRQPPTPSTVLINNSYFVKKINKLKKKISHGICGISNEILKKLPTNSFPKITLLINNIFKYSYFLLYWKTSITAPVPKHPKPLEMPTSYRPIYLFKSLSEFTKTFIAQHLNDHSHLHNILTPVYFSFHADLPSWTKFIF